MRERRYIKLSSKVKSLTHLFLVAKTWIEKGTEKRVNDIRMVYDSVWDPWPSIHTVESYLKVVKVVI